MYYSNNLNALSIGTKTSKNYKKISQSSDENGYFKKAIHIIGIAVTVTIIAVVLMINTSNIVKSSEFDKSPSYITVKSGDTLWSIAKSISTNENDIRKVCEDIKIANTLSTSVLKVGQVIEIPGEYN